MFGAASAFAQGPAAAPASPSASAPAGGAPGNSPLSTSAAAPLSATLTGQAKEDYDSAKLLYVDGDYATAGLKFRRAFDASKDPRLLWNVAACEKALRHYTKALNLVERYEKEGGALLTPADRKEADDLATALRATTDTLSISTNVGGADVLVDDENVATTPLDHVIRVDLGDHHVVIQKSGYVSYNKTTSFTGAGVSLQVALEKEEHVGELRVDAAPEDAIVVDGKLQANGSSLVKLPSGTHTLNVSARGKQTYQSDIVVQDHQTTTVHVHLNKEKEGGGSAVPWIIGGAVIVAGGIVGGYFAFRKNDNTTGNGTSGTLGTINLSSLHIGH